ncbi:MAG: nicotinate-nucleotide adenylyltransferase, partial [Pyrinomonadaceae bacterium]
MTRKIAFYGGSFDPVHRGHLAVGVAVLAQFGLDDFVFVPAFHAPHKSRKRPTSAYDRYAMLCLVTRDEPAMRVSRIEIEAPERPYSVETLSRLKDQLPDDRIFFVMGADSWEEITTWRDWETVLSLTDHIIVTRPGYDIGSTHLTDTVRSRVVDVRGHEAVEVTDEGSRIYITDAVNVDVSATEVRHKIANGEPSWRDDVPGEVA